MSILPAFLRHPPTPSLRLLQAGSSHRARIALLFLVIVSLSLFLLHRVQLPQGLLIPELLPHDKNAQTATAKQAQPTSSEWTGPEPLPASELDDGTLRSLPSIYQETYREEKLLPQHNASLPFPEGKNGRFLWMSNQVWGLGFNNAFQTFYMLALLAYLSDRAFVFRPYVWDLGSEPFVEFYGSMIPSRIPLTAMLSGPIVGGPFPAGDPAPRAVNLEWFKNVCPPSRTKVLSADEINEGLWDAEASDIMAKYLAVLKDVPDGCVELGGEQRPFDWMLFGTTKLLSIWPALSTSPIMTHLGWSPLVNSALSANAKALSPSLLHDPMPPIAPDLLAIHVRRGDYDKHCHFLANWSAHYMGWARFPGLPDTFDPPPGGGENENTPENRAIYLRRCWPTIEQIVKKVRDVRRAWEEGVGAETGESGRRPEHIWPLRRVHIMTNGKPEWVGALKEALLALGDLDSVSTGSDLALNEPQKHISQAIDMAIGERAAVFIGTGFSSLTANVVMLRIVRGHPVGSNRFW